MSKPPDSLCVIRLSAIGDCCHTLPVVRAIRRAWPNTRMTWIIGQTEHALLEGLEGVEFLVLDKRAGRRGMRDLKARLASRRFDLVLQMQASFRASRVALMTGCRRRVGFDRARARDVQWLFTTERIAPRPGQHVMEALFGFAEHLGIKMPAEPRWDFPLTARDRQAVAALSPAEPFCLLSPLSSQRRGAFRNWPAERYAEVARHVVERLGGRVLLTGSGSALEREYAGVIGAVSGVIDLNGRTTLKQLAALIGSARIVVCPDSGPAHIAAAMGVPVVGLYASSNRRLFFRVAGDEREHRSAVRAGGILAGLDGNVHARMRVPAHRPGQWAGHGQVLLRHQIAPLHIGLDLRPAGGNTHARKYIGDALLRCCCYSPR